MTGKTIGASDIPVPNQISTELLGATTAPVADNKFLPSVETIHIVSQTPGNLFVPQ